MKLNNMKKIKQGRDQEFNFGLRKSEMAEAMISLQLEMKKWRSEERFRLDSKYCVTEYG